MRNSRILRRGVVCVTVAAATGAAACKSRENPRTVTDTAGAAAHPASGGGEAAGARPVAMRTFNGDRTVAVAGRQLFLDYNCYGCHGGLAGGAMGPSLRDDEWKFGGTDSAIHNSIAQGRPAGMPKWAGMMPDSDITKLVVYIRSLRTPAEPTFFFSPTDTTTHTATTASR
jgi:mono/diheme cytochrome c family protein